MGFFFLGGGGGGMDMVANFKSISPNLSTIVGEYHLRPGQGGLKQLKICGDFISLLLLA